MHFWGDLVIGLSPIKNSFQFPSSVTYYERALDILKICMDYSAGHPLSIYLFMDSSYYAEEHIFVVDILDALIGQSMRWQKVHFHLQEVELQRLHRVKGHLPLLQSITLTRIYDPYYAGKLVNERFADSFSDSPSLTHLHVSAITTWKFDWSLILVPKLLEPLMDEENLLSILPQATRLEELELGGANDYSRPIHERIRSVVTLPSLKKLVFHGLYMMGVLAAPNLVHLSLVSYGSSYGDGPAKALIVSFIRRSSCPTVEHLQLWGLRPGIVAEVLPLFPSLIRLQVHSRDLKGLIASLNWNETPRVPRLKSLEISSPDYLHRESVAGLSAIVASRARNPEVGLQELVVSTHGSPFDVDLMVLQQKCDEQGVKLTVSLVKMP